MSCGSNNSTKLLLLRTVEFLGTVVIYTLGVGVGELLHLILTTDIHDEPET